MRKIPCATILLLEKCASQRELPSQPWARVMAEVGLARLVMTTWLARSMLADSEMKALCTADQSIGKRRSAQRLAPGHPRGPSSSGLRGEQKFLAANQQETIGDELGFWETRASDGFPRKLFRVVEKTKAPSFGGSELPGSQFQWNQLPAHFTLVLAREGGANIEGPPMRVAAAAHCALCLPAVVPYGRTRLRGRRTTVYGYFIVSIFSLSNQR